MDHGSDCWHYPAHLTCKEDQAQSVHYYVVIRLGRGDAEIVMDFVVMDFVVVVGRILRTSCVVVVLPDHGLSYFAVIVGAGPVQRHYDREQLAMNPPMMDGEMQDIGDAALLHAYEVQCDFVRLRHDRRR